jgi:hypothetical protein
MDDPHRKLKMPAMGRRVLVLPLAILLSLALLLAALTAAGGIPTSIATPVISGVVAAMLTGGLALLGIWMNVRYQIDRDRVTLLRDSYAKLLRASVKVRETHSEMLLFPQGRPYPGPIPITASSEAWRDFYKHEPREVEHALIDAAMDLFTEAETVIYLEQGAESPVLKAWEELATAFELWRGAVLIDDSEKAKKLQGGLQNALLELRQTAHNDLKKLARGKL